MARAVAICLGVVLAAAGVARADKPRIAVLGLEVARGPSGAADPGVQLIAREVTRELRLRMQAPACPYAVAPNSNKELLDEKQLMSCEAEAVDCMVVIAAGLVSDAMLYGRVDRRGEGFRISLKLLDARRRVVQLAVDDMSGGGGVTGAARRLYRRLIGDGPSGDGKLLVASGAREAVAPPRPEQPATGPSGGPSPLWRLALVLGTATAVAGGGLAWYSYDRQIANVRKVGVTVDSSLCGSDGDTLRMDHAGIDVHSFDRACTWTTRTYLGYGIAGVGAAAAVVSLIILTRDPSPSDSAATAARAARSAIAFGPLVAPGVTGAQLAVDW